MQLIIQSVNSAVVVNVENACLSSIKAAIEDVEFIPSAMMRLVKNSTELEDESLEGLIEEGDILDLLVDVSGGMRAKWRKKRMRRLRRKRRKMRSRAR